MNAFAWMLLTGGFGFGFLVGTVLTDHFHWNYVLTKAERKDRTAICIRGKFYYVIPETEFVHEWVPRELVRKP